MLKSLVKGAPYGATQRIKEVGFVNSRFFASKTVSDYHPTIFSLSSKFGKSAIGVVRISGSQSLYVYHSLTRRSRLPKERMASLRKLYSPESNVLLDEAITLYFKAPRTYTGEDILELYLHGGSAIIQSVLNSIKSLHNPSQGVHLRYAEKGEFSQRAFFNGKFDLTEIEGIREMIDAETESQRVSALASIKGDNKHQFLEWRNEIVNNIAFLTTLIDFGEEHDLEEVAGLLNTVDNNINILRKEVIEYLTKVKGSTILMKGIKLILLGPPNAGKSSLLNSVTNKDAAIVSDIAGTTRDVIDIPIDINGYKIIIGDTAGIRSEVFSDKIELEGVRRAKLRALEGDIILILIPLTDCQASDISTLVEQAKILKSNGKRVLLILNKEDLLSDNAKKKAVDFYSHQFCLNLDEIHLVSCKNGKGITFLLTSLTDMFKSITRSEVNDPISLSERAQDLLQNDVIYAFDQFKVFKELDDVVLASESLKQAADGIGKITGEAIGLDEVLDVVFSNFCIGK